MRLEMARLFKNVEDCHALLMKEFPMPIIQIGGLGGGSGRVSTPSGITFDAKDVKLLREMMEKGCEMYIQVVPTQQKYEVDKVIDKLDFHE